ncbi:ParB/RepB/Spo0J family partition protein [Clostridiales Family XIII bacterium RF-744-FAT-WT-3]|uniref:ParB/RepB/Spo0J family partition protein n=1 Tax=Baileyella intestinalis TaxID=2606709 RepID=A0A6A8M8K3_9FIRM|nr:ParB/RepB/Spo0J family partition protein [Baileyella intestinalis]MST69672.1 ParB/RepB/Spo0J family partition protein [Baileyella intestinalis]
MPDETFQKNKPHSTNENTFYSNEDKSGSAQRKIYAIPISEIDTFPKHPFHVKEDEDMKALVDSIRMNGVLTPAAVRKKENGRYELLSGHRRKRACEIAGLSTLPCKIVELNQDEAVIFMVDSNLQRTEILPSEKAFSYKMRLDAMKRQGKRTDLTSAPLEQKLEQQTSRNILANQIGESSEQVRRYIRLTHLIPSLLRMVDEKKIALRPAVELSYLPREWQEVVVAAVHYQKRTPSHTQAKELRKLAESSSLTRELVYQLLGEKKPNQKDRVILKADTIRTYLPKDLPASQREEYIIKALDHYGKYRARRERAKHAR